MHVGRDLVSAVGLYFFFSSRRRHTRSLCDWSSDVCSSDLYATRAGEVPVIPALSFRVSAGEAMGLVGESGCGKSTVALSIVRYLGRAGRLVRGRILFEGRDLATLDDEELRAVRGRRIAMVYQDPMASLNPVMTVGRQLMEVPMLHEGVGAATAHARAIEMLREVKLSDPEAVMARYPHQLDRKSTRLNSSHTVISYAVFCLKKKKV